MSSSLIIIFLQILNWKQYLGVPNPTGDGRTLSPEAESLIKSLLCDEKHRLGSAPSLPEKPSGGASEIKKHPFFNSINFPQVEAHQMESLWRPPIQDPEDPDFSGIVDFSNATPGPDGSWCITKVSLCWQW